MKKIILIVNILAFIVSLLWLILRPDFEPLITSLLTLGGLIGFAITRTKEKNEKVTMSQESGKKSKQYQAGGNMTIKN